MRKANGSGISATQRGITAGAVIRRACRGIAAQLGSAPPRLEHLELRQLLTATIEYKFDGDPGGTALDTALWDGAQDAFHMATPTNGRFLDGLMLSGAEALQVSDLIDTRIGGTASVSFWIRTTSTGSNNPRFAPGLMGAAETNAIDDIVWGFFDASGRVGLFSASQSLPAGGRDTVKSAQPINNGEWHHIAMTRDAATGEIAIYVDGILNDSAAATPGVKTNFINEIAVIRGQGVLSYLSGVIDEVVIDNELLTAQQIAQQFDPSGTAPAAPTLTGLTAGARAVEVAWQGNSPNASGYIIERSTDGGATFAEAGRAIAGATRFVDKNLSPATTYHYRVRAYNPTAPATSPGAPSAIQSATTGTPGPEGDGTGLLGIYYDEGGQRQPTQSQVNPDSNFKGRIAVHPAEVVNFNWGNGSPDPLIGPDRFSVRWTGKLIPQYTEYYTFYTLTDDGAFLYIDGQQIIQDPTYHGASAADEKSSEAMVPGGLLLQAGQEYDIRLEMYDGDFGAVAQLRWESLSTPKEIIPATQLKPQSFTAAPATPASLTATAIDSDTINLAWDESTDIIGYRVYRSTSSAPSAYELVATVGNNAFSDRVFPGQTYHYQVTAFNSAPGSGESARSPVASATTPALTVEPGLIGTYFPNRTLSEPAAGTRIDSAIDKSYGSGQASNPGYWGNGTPGFPGIGADNFSIRWEGSITPAQSGLYTFFPTSDDGIRLWVNGELLTNGWRNRGTTEDTSRAIPLQAGTAYPILVEYYEASGNAVAQLRWRATDAQGMELIAKDLVSADVFSTAVTPPASASAPTALTGQATTTTALLTWTDNSLSEHSNLIEIETPDVQPGLWSPFVRATAVSNPNAGAGAGSYTVTGLEPDTTYRFRIRAQNAAGESFSNIITLTTAPAGSGTVTVADTSGDTDLSTEGTIDWSHWGHDNDAALRNTRTNYVSIEAEDALLTDPNGDGRGWRIVDATTSPAAAGPNSVASGGRALLADVPPNDSTTNNGLARFQIYFPQAGTYQLYTRRRHHDVDGGGTNGDNNSIYVPPAYNPGSAIYNNTDLPGGDRWDQGPGTPGNFRDFAWHTDTRRLYTITQPGPITFTIGTREGGYVLDRIVLSTTMDLSGAQLEAMSNSGSKRIGGPISDITPIGAGTVLQQAHTPGKTFTWSHAQPSPNVTATDDAVAVTGAGSGLRFTAAAGTTPRRLKVYVGVDGTTAQLTATMSDGSIAPIVSTLADDTGPGQARTVVYSIDFAAETPNQTIAIELLNQGAGQLILQAATLIELQKPAAAGNVSATPLSETSVRLSWTDSAANETGYRVERWIEGSPAPQVTSWSLPANSTSFRDIEAEPGTTYGYRVVAIGSAGESLAPAVTAVTPASTLPAPWKSRDVGTGADPAVVGDASFDGTTWTITSGGSDIWNPADHFHYLYRTISGDGSIVARVADVANTDGWAKAGVMIREDLSPQARHAFMMVTPANQARFHGRTSAGGGSFGMAAPAGSTSATGWVKLERVGNSFRAYWSADGINWLAAGTQNIAMGQTVMIGLAATAHSTSKTNISTFDNVTVTGGEAPAGINLTGTAAADNWHLKRNANLIEVRNNADGSGAAVSTHAMGSDFTLSGGDGDDTVTVDLSGGDISLGAFTITGDAGSDRVRLINGDGRTLTLGGVPTLNGKSLDLGTGDLKVTGGTAAAVEALVATARAGAIRWHGPGIGTTSAASHTGLAVVSQGADTLVKFSYNGDANGDGLINADDYFRIDSGFLSPPAAPLYAQGDFNFDDTINADDYFLIDSAFLGQGAPVAQAAPTVATAESLITASEPETRKSRRTAAVDTSLFSARRIEKRSQRRGR